MRDPVHRILCLRASREEYGVWSEGSNGQLHCTFRVSCRDTTDVIRTRERGLNWIFACCVLQANSDDQCTLYLSVHTSDLDNEVSYR
jgi:hypothetical protein